MCIRNVISAIMGAVVVFAWSALSWMYLTWHSVDMKPFKKDGQAIVESVKVETVESGIYVLPKLPDAINKTPEAQQEWSQKALKGPFVFMSVKAEGRQWDMNTSLAIQFGIQFLIALGVVWVLGHARTSSLWHRTLLASVTVTLGATMVGLCHWNWWGFPLNMTLVNIADTAIAWFLGGFVIALFMKKA